MFLKNKKIDIKTIIAHYCALGMAEFLFDGEPVCVLGVNMIYNFSFCLDLKPMNGGWMVFHVLV